jgi:hypothetical protein
MKETNELENQLNSWKPRRPSAKIKRRLFPTPHARPELVRMLNWLAPATVCMLLALAAFRQENSLPVAAPHHEPLIAMILSNQNAVVYLPGGSSQIEHNLLPGTVELTNRSGSGSIPGFTSLKKTND